MYNYIYQGPLGLHFVSLKNNEGACIKKVIPNTQASLSDIVKGDMLIQINNVGVETFKFQEILPLLKSDHRSYYWIIIFIIFDIFTLKRPLELKFRRNINSHYDSSLMNRTENESENEGILNWLIGSSWFGSSTKSNSNEIQSTITMI